MTDPIDRLIDWVDYVESLDVDRTSQNDQKRYLTKVARLTYEALPDLKQLRDRVREQQSDLKLSASANAKLSAENVALEDRVRDLESENRALKVKAMMLEETQSLLVNLAHEAWHVLDDHCVEADGSVTVLASSMEELNVAFSPFLQDLDHDDFHLWMEALLNRSNEDE